MNPSDSSRGAAAPRFFGREKVYLPTGTAASRFDAWAMHEAGVPSAVLMENAGRSAALLLDHFHPTGSIVVLAGSGNNGGDGLVLARTLLAQGREVRLLSAVERPERDPLLHGWTLPMETAPEDDAALDAALAGAAVLVDALLGTGATGAPRGPHARLIRALGRSSAPVMALDIPSGVDANTGRVVGEAVRAGMTVAFGSPKLGSLLLPGREYSGRLLAVEIGFPPMDPEGVGASLITPGWAERLRPRRAPAAHKKAAGRVLVLAGSPGMAGAAVLCARGALRAGAGYVQIASAPQNREILQAAVPEAIFVDATETEHLTRCAQDCDVLAAGPGMGTGEADAERLNRLLALPGLEGVVLDADALTLLGAGSLPAFPGETPASRRLLTPHPGEMARLGAVPDDIRNLPLEVCRAGAERWASAVLLKGAPSVIAAPDEPHVLVSGTGSSDLARAGMGDVLTGAAGAFLARGGTAVEAAALALHYTGLAAGLAGRREALLPTDVAEYLGVVLAGGGEPGREPVFPFVTLDLDPVH
jgi:ADP-dependent NAD(P)H-hydrate dehydratase / NAD(P)H-hydrate epimerase